MGTLTEEVMAEESARAACQTCLWLATKPAEVDEWQQILADRSRQHSAISRIMFRRGINISQESVRRHREKHIWSRSGPG